MARYRPDYTMQKAKEQVDKIKNSTDPDDILLKYYFQKRDEQIKKLQEENKEYKQFFNTLYKFLPKKYVAPPVFG